MEIKLTQVQVQQIENEYNEFVSKMEILRGKQKVGEYVDGWKVVHMMDNISELKKILETGEIKLF